jgi:hypothetical protein
VHRPQSGSGHRDGMADRQSRTASVLRRAILERQTQGQGLWGRFVLCVFVLWTSATRPPNRVTAHRHHDVTHASISLGPSQRNPPLGRLNDRHDSGSVPRGRLRTKASMWRSPVDAASCPASAPSTTFAHSANANVCAAQRICDVVELVYYLMALHLCFIEPIAISWRRSSPTNRFFP